MPTTTSSSTQVTPPPEWLVLADSIARIAPERLPQEARLPTVGWSDEWQPNRLVLKQTEGEEFDRPIFFREPGYAGGEYSAGEMNVRVTKQNDQLYFERRDASDPSLDELIEAHFVKRLFSFATDVMLFAGSGIRNIHRTHALYQQGRGVTEGFSAAHYCAMANLTDGFYLMLKERLLKCGQERKLDIVTERWCHSILLEMGPHKAEAAINTIREAVESADAAFDEQLIGEIFDSVDTDHLISISSYLGVHRNGTDDLPKLVNDLDRLIEYPEGLDIAAIYEEVSDGSLSMQEGIEKGFRGIQEVYSRVYDQIERMEVSLLALLQVQAELYPLIKELVEVKENAPKNSFESLPNEEKFGYIERYLKLVEKGRYLWSVLDGKGFETTRDQFAYGLLSQAGDYGGMIKVDNQSIHGLSIGFLMQHERRVLRFRNEVEHMKSRLHDATPISLDGLQNLLHHLNQLSDLNWSEDSWVWFQNHATKLLIEKMNRTAAYVAGLGAASEADDNYRARLADHKKRLERLQCFHDTLTRLTPGALSLFLMAHEKAMKERFGEASSFGSNSVYDGGLGQEDEASDDSYILDQESFAQEIEAVTDVSSEQVAAVAEMENGATPPVNDEEIRCLIHMLVIGETEQLREQMNAIANRIDTYPEESEEAERCRRLLLNQKEGILSREYSFRFEELQSVNEGLSVEQGLNELVQFSQLRDFQLISEEIEAMKAESPSFPEMPDIHILQLDEFWGLSPEEKVQFFADARNGLTEAIDRILEHIDNDRTFGFTYTRPDNTLEIILEKKWLAGEPFKAVVDLELLEKEPTYIENLEWERLAGLVNEWGDRLPWTTIMGRLKGLIEHPSLEDKKDFVRSYPWIFCPSRANVILELLSQLNEQKRVCEIMVNSCIALDPEELFKEFSCDPQALFDRKMELLERKLVVEREEVPLEQLRDERLLDEVRLQLQGEGGEVVLASSHPGYFSSRQDLKRLSLETQRQMNLAIESYLTSTAHESSGRSILFDARVLV